MVKTATVIQEGHIIKNVLIHSQRDCDKLYEDCDIFLGRGNYRIMVD